MSNRMSSTVPIRSRLLLCALALSWLGHAAFAEDIVSGRFELVDHRGQTVTERSFDGKLRLVFFGFTQCPHICPMTLFEVGRVMERLGDDATKVQPLFISVDREHDTPEVIASYVGAFHPSLLGLTGSEQQLKAAASSFRVTYGVQPASESASGRDTVSHSTYLFLMDRQGRFLDTFGYGSKADVILSGLREHL